MKFETIFPHTKGGFIEKKKKLCQKIKRRKLKNKIKRTNEQINK